jgi:pimeloyl-ACP methyl ester carboxylesterase
MPTNIFGSRTSVHLAKGALDVIAAVVNTPGVLDHARIAAADNFAVGGLDLIDPGGLTTPPFYATRAGTDLLVFIGGIQSINQARDVILGYQGGANPNISNPQNVNFENAANAIYAKIIAAGMTPVQRLFVAGHSWGGCVAYEMIRQAPVNIPQATRYQYCTFGAPRYSAPRQAAIMAAHEGARWFWFADPVPLLPPRSADSLISQLGLPARVAQRFDRFVHPKGGLCIKDAFTILPLEEPPGALPPSVIVMATWLVVRDTTVGDAHSVASYQATFGKILTVRAGMADPPRVASTERLQSFDRRAFIQNEREQANNVFAVERQQNQVPVHVPAPARFRAIRMGRVWGLTFGGETVCIVGRRRKALGLARRGNEWLDSLQSTAVVDPQAMLQQFSAYMAAAGSPLGGFRPVMNQVNQ